MGARGSDLGLDSLISVDIRSWFLKNFQASIPVLKIMSSDIHMHSLVEIAAESVPAALVPHMGGVDKSPTSRGDSSATGTEAESGLQSPADANVETPTSSSERSSSQDRREPADKIDWHVESTPPDGLVKLSTTIALDKSPSVVLLTGVSGLLGRHLLNSLMAQPSIRKIICIAVRQLSERIETKQIPAPSDRVVYYEGDLSLAQFGLSAGTLSSIFEEVEAVIHNGSDTSHLKYYHSLRDTNVGSTLQILRLCIPRMIPLHYVSSAGVALFAGDGPFPEISATTNGKLPPDDGAHGYMCGKWVNEMLLERVNAQYGLKVCIHRPSTIIREGDDATAARAEFDWVNALLHYSHRIEAVPKVVHTRGRFDLVYVRSVCDDIVRELLANKKSELAGGITYVNNVGDITIAMDRMADLGKQVDKMPYMVLPMEQWMQKAIAAGLHPAVAALIETFDEPGGPVYPILLKSRV